MSDRSDTSPRVENNHQGGNSVKELAEMIGGLNLAGLAFVAKRTLGTKPEEVTRQYTLWVRSDNAALPSITTPLWQALAPLGVERPDQDGAAVCDDVLIGRVADAQIANDAAKRCAEVAKKQVADNTFVDDGTNPAVSELIGLVKDFWRASGNVASELHTRVVTGEYDGSVRLVNKTVDALKPLTERVAELSLELGGGTAANTAPETEVIPVAEPPSYAPEPILPTEKPLGGDLEQIEQQAEAFANSRPLELQRVSPAGVAATSGPKVISTKPVPERRIAPILFVVIAIGIALFMIYQSMNGYSPFESFISTVTLDFTRIEAVLDGAINEVSRGR